MVTAKGHQDIHIGGGQGPHCFHVGHGQGPLEVSMLFMDKGVQGRARWSWPKDPKISILVVAKDLKGSYGRIIYGQMLLDHCQGPQCLIVVKPSRSGRDQEAEKARPRLKTV